MVYGARAGMQSSRSAHQLGVISGDLTVRRSIDILLILVAMSIVGCGKEVGEGSGGQVVRAGPIGGPGSGGPGPAPVSTPTDSIIGVWQIAETTKTANDANCQPPASPLATYILYVAQNGTTAIAE